MILLGAWIKSRSLRFRHRAVCKPLVNNNIVCGDGFGGVQALIFTQSVLFFVSDKMKEVHPSHGHQVIIQLKLADSKK